MTLKQKENFLDYIPGRNESLFYKENEKGCIEIIRKNKGIINLAVQTFLGKPKISRIELDRLGSYVWNQIDGRQDVYQIGERIKENFGTDAEPLYERLTEFLFMLYKNGFIVYINLQKE